ncbi:12778_t:CDS:2, partial [Gigaspora margarita]
FGLEGSQVPDKFDDRILATDLTINLEAPFKNMVYPLVGIITALRRQLNSEAVNEEILTYGSMED